MTEIMIEKSIADKYKEAIVDMRNYETAFLNLDLTEEERIQVGYHQTDSMSFNDACRWIYTLVYGNIRIIKIK